MTADAVAAQSTADVLAHLGTSKSGLSSAEAAARLSHYGPNSLRTHRVSGWAVLRRQLNNAVLALLAVTAVVSFFLGDNTQAIIIGVILAVSIGLGFVNEYRAERASAALHSRVRHNAVVRRDGRDCKINVNEFSTYVAVDRSIAAQALHKLSAGKVKGKTVKVRLLDA